MVGLVLPCQGCHQGLSLQLAHLNVIERDVIVHVGGAGDQAVIRNDRHILSLGCIGDGSGSGRVNRIKNQDLGAVGQGSFSLLLLGRSVLIGIAVDQVVGHIETKGGQLGLEIGQVLGLIACGLGLRQQDGDLGSATGSTRRCGWHGSRGRIGLRRAWQLREPE